VDNYRIIQNDAADAKSHISVGRTSTNNEIKVLTEYVKCDVRILTGFIEPHFFAGFSGGPKACVPGLADMDTILRNHSPVNIDNQDAAWGHTADNPIWKELLEAAELAGEAFLLNVALNTEQKVTGVFAGELKLAHQKGCDFVKENAMAPVKEPYDIVITSNSGYPLDLNMYQSVKGLSAAARIVKQNGTIIIAAECWDGIPSHGMYGKLLTESKTPLELLAKIRSNNFLCHDSWQAQIHALICEKARIHFYSDNLTDDQISGAFMRPCRDIAAAVKAIAAGKSDNLKICILPDGPLTIPYLALPTKNVFP
jgi:nickel-dependent lactate racemase